MTITVFEFVPILSMDDFIAFNAERIQKKIFVFLYVDFTNHRVVFRKYLMMLFQYDNVNIPYYLIEELMKMFY